MSTPLDPSGVTVESFETEPSDATLYPTRPTTMKTYEPGCTTPELCPITP